MATFHVDRDGRGGVAGSDATWTVAARAGDATKPYATIAAAQQQVTAANPAGGDTIRVHRETTATPYPEPVTTGLAPTVKNTLIAHDLAGEGRPTVDGITLATATRWRVEGMTFVNFVRISDGRFLELVNNLGRTRTPSSATSGNFYVQGLNNSTIQGNDWLYTGPPVSQLAAEVVPLNFTADVATQSNNTITGNRFDGFPGDFINGPGATTMANWTITGNEFGRAFAGTLNNGRALHTDVIQWETGPNDCDNLVVAGNIFYGKGGTGRLMLMAQQGSGGTATGLGRFTNLQVVQNVWYDNDDFCCRIFSAPGVLIANNTVWPGSTNPTHGLDLRSTQNPTASAASTLTRNVRLKANILRGILVDAGVTFVADSGYNLFPTAAARSGYTKRTTDLADGSPTFTSTTYDAAAGIQPNLRLASGSRGVEEGPLLTDSTAMTGVPTVDADGKARVGSRADVGAYEFGTPAAPPPAPPPIANLVVSPNPALTGQIVTIDASGSTGTITLYEVTYDGGATWSTMARSSIINALTAGTYDVRVRVTGPTGTTTTGALTLLVEDEVPVVPTPPVDPVDPGGEGGTVGVNQQRLILDPTVSPLVLMNRTPDGTYGAATGIYLLSHGFPAPQASRLGASSFETEGENLGDEAHWDPRSIPLAFDVHGTDDANLRDLMRMLDQKVAKLARRGGELQWRHPFGNTITFDVTKVDTYEPTYDDRFYSGHTVPVTLTLTARPFGRGTETQPTPQSQSGTPGLRVVYYSNTPGDVPAVGRLEMVTPETAGASGIRQFWYGMDSEATGYIEGVSWPLAYTALNGQIVNGTISAATNATSGQALRYVMPAGATEYPLFFAKAFSSIYLNLAGTFRLFVRARNTTGGGVRVAARYWPNGSSGSATTLAADPAGADTPWSDYVAASTSTNWTIHDLGLIRLNQVANRRGGSVLVLARADAANQDVVVDELWLMPTEVYGNVQALGDFGGTAVIASDRAYFRRASTNLETDPSGFAGDYIRVPTGDSRLLVYASSMVPEWYDPGDAEDVAPTTTATLYVTPRYLNVPD